MKKKVLLILGKFAPSVLLMLLAFTQGVTTGFLNLFLFILIYALVFFYFINNEKFFNIVAIALTGLILDSVNDIYLGLNSFIFLCIYAITAIEMKYIKIKDFLSTYFFYLINIMITTIFMLFLSFIIHTNFVGLLEFIIISLLIFPVLYNVIKIYKIIAPKSYEK